MSQMYFGADHRDKKVRCCQAVEPAYKSVNVLFFSRLKRVPYWRATLPLRDYRSAHESIHRGIVRGRRQRRAIAPLQVGRLSYGPQPLY